MIDELNSLLKDKEKEIIECKNYINQIKTNVMLILMN